MLRPWSQTFKGWNDIVGATVAIRRIRRANALSSCSLSPRTVETGNPIRRDFPKSTFHPRCYTTTLHRPSEHSRPNEEPFRTEPNPNEEESRTGKHEPSSSSCISTIKDPTSTDPPTGNLSIVFTDIVKSTAMWESDAQAMADAMHMHDAMIRSLTISDHGYEVKQNGDGFMIAFPSATTAVQFCLDVQEQLLDEAWPQGILNQAQGETCTDVQGHVLFRGLKLRMSAHWGAPVCKWNDVIQRMDYLGPMVNRAARFIEVTEGGQIVVSEDFLVQLQHELDVVEGRADVDESQPDSSTKSSTKSSSSSSSTTTTHVNLPRLKSDSDQDKLTHQHFEIRPLGDHEFRGLNDPESLYFIVPRSLQGRVDHWHQVKHVSGVKGNLRSPRG